MHTLAWVAWVALVMTVALTTNNPYYLAIVFLSVILVAVLAPKTGTGIAGFRVLLFFGLGLFAISMGIAVINGNFGDHILFTLPGPELPDWLGGLRLGGPVSGEGLVAAAIRGLAILTVLLAFGVFNGAVSPHRVLRTAFVPTRTRRAVARPISRADALVSWAIPAGPVGLLAYGSP